MTEDFLQYLWKFKKFKFSDLKTTNNESIILQHTGWHNELHSGPDFFDARLIIEGQKWAGTIEVHLTSGDWYVHNHENDPAYDNVILHVVWEHDVDIFRKDNTVIPTLELKQYVSQDILSNYKELFYKGEKKQIACKKELKGIPDFILSGWQERLYLERLESKTVLISELLKESANDWEVVLFKMLAKNFGLKTNGEAFLSIANSINFSILRKCINRLDLIEALFFGQADLLDYEMNDAYAMHLNNEYAYIKNKFKLNNTGVLPVQFFRLRPSNFPTIRLAQLAMLYFKNKNLFQDVIRFQTPEKFYELFKVGVSNFWTNHYTFNKESKTVNKNISKSFIDLLLINTIIPIKFVYQRSIGHESNEEVFDMITQISSEKNSIIDNFTALQTPIENAMHSQAMIQLKTIYCDKNACLRCEIGNFLLNKSNI
ncbi:DUF2851 family protein [Aquimarina sp. 2201CG1-2-11]|uniref:DUF2851 family protein n=1 Tax=Aquimarina discodermiae TaxID=3231043 RepID=UPI00346259D1